MPGGCLRVNSCRCSQAEAAYSQQIRYGSETLISRKLMATGEILYLLRDGSCGVNSVTTQYTPHVIKTKAVTCHFDRTLYIIESISLKHKLVLK